MTFPESMAEVYSSYHSQLPEYVSSIPLSTYVFSVLAICLPPLVALAIYESDDAKLRALRPKGCKRLGIQGKSNLRDEFNERILKGQSEYASAEGWKLKSMWIYPVKSCRGVELETGTIVATGMEYDRQFMFAQLRSPFPVSAGTPEKEKAAHKWEFITQRQFPLLAKIRTEIWVPDQSVDFKDVQSGGALIISYPYQERGWRGLISKWAAILRRRVPEKHLKISLNSSPAESKKRGYTQEDVIIWKETINALNMETDIPPELRLFLGTSNRLGLFRVDNTKLREVHRNAPTKELLGYQPVTGFQDAYPLHLLNLASVRDVESKLPSVKGTPKLSVVRFRANLIITGPGVYEEDTWKRIKIGAYEYDVSCRTARCKMPNVDPETAKRHPSEPDRTLRKLRAVDEGAGANVGCLGVQMVPILQQSVLRVGDQVTVLEVGEHCYIQQ